MKRMGLNGMLALLAGGIACGGPDADVKIEPAREAFEARHRDRYLELKTWIDAREPWQPRPGRVKVFTYHKTEDRWGGGNAPDFASSLDGMRDHPVADRWAELVVPGFETPDAVRGLWQSDVPEDRERVRALLTLPGARASRALMEAVDARDQRVQAARVPQVAEAKTRLPEMRALYREHTDTGERNPARASEWARIRLTLARYLIFVNQPGAAWDLLYTPAWEEGKPSNATEIHEAQTALWAKARQAIRHEGPEDERQAIWREAREFAKLQEDWMGLSNRYAINNNPYWLNRRFTRGKINWLAGVADRAERHFYKTRNYMPRSHIHGSARIPYRKRNHEIEHYKESVRRVRWYRNKPASFHWFTRADIARSRGRHTLARLYDLRALSETKPRTPDRQRAMLRQAVGGGWLGHPEPAVRDLRALVSKEDPLWVRPAATLYLHVFSVLAGEDPEPHAEALARLYERVKASIADGSSLYDPDTYPADDIPAWNRLVRDSKNRRILTLLDPGASPHAGNTPWIANAWLVDIARWQVLLDTMVETDDPMAAMNDLSAHPRFRAHRGLRRDRGQAALWVEKQETLLDPVLLPLFDERETRRYLLAAHAALTRDYEAALATVEAMDSTESQVEKRQALQLIEARVRSIKDGGPSEGAFRSVEHGIGLAENSEIGHYLRYTKAREFVDGKNADRKRYSLYRELSDSDPVTRWTLLARVELERGKIKQEKRREGAEKRLRAVAAHKAADEEVVEQVNALLAKPKPDEE